MSEGDRYIGMSYAELQAVISREKEMKRPDDAVDCPKCTGSGRHTYADASGNTSHDDCERCDGKGWVTSLQSGEPGYDNPQFSGDEPSAPMRSIQRMTGQLRTEPAEAGEGTRRVMTPASERVELSELLKRAASYTMTDAERYAQQRSWALGEYLIAHPDATRTEALQLVDAALKAAGVYKPLTARWIGIYKLTEEMGELNQVLGKIGPFPDGEHPDGGPPLAQRAAEEMADVEAAIQYFREQNNLDPLPERRAHKLQLFRQWGLTGVPV